MLALLIAVAQASRAEAHALTATITPPAAAAVEDSEFTIAFGGDVTALPDGSGYIEARIRRGVAAPCAATQRDDPGDPVIFSPVGVVPLQGAFSAIGSYMADDPGEYLICAWIEDEFGASGPPSAARMSVRAPVLRIAVDAPESVRGGAAFEIGVDYAAEVPRYLSVLLVQAPRCPVTSRHLAAVVRGAIAVVDNVQVSGEGSTSGRARLRTAGTYLVCGYLDELFLGSSRAQLVVQAATITVPVPGFRACGSPGGRRHVRDVQARRVPCAAARALALRWAARRPAPSRLGAYRCVAGSGRATCAAGRASVRFRYGRR